MYIYKILLGSTVALNVNVECEREKVERERERERAREELNRYLFSSPTNHQSWYQTVPTRLYLPDCTYPTCTFTVWLFPIQVIMSSHWTIGLIGPKRVGGPCENTPEPSPTRP
jgi:hypothetical protein